MWNEDFYFRVSDLSNLITFNCFDKDILKSDLVGEEKIRIGDLVNGAEDRFVTLCKHGRKTVDL